MQLIPIKEHLHENKQFTDDPDCKDTIYMSVDFFKKIGYHPPWIGYYAHADGQLVGCAAFKGKPVNGRVEIAYGVFPHHQQKGIGTRIAAELVQLALKTDPALVIMACTLPEENYSTRILRKNNFKLAGTAADDEVGEVWEWEYMPHPTLSTEEGL